MSTKGNPTVTVRLQPWMLKALEHLSAHEVSRRTSKNETGTGLRSEIRHAVLLYLLSHVEAGDLPLQLISQDERWRLKASDWRALDVTEKKATR